MAFSSSYRSFFGSSEAIKACYLMVSRFVGLLPSLDPLATSPTPPRAGDLSALPSDLTTGVRSGGPSSSVASLGTLARQSSRSHGAGSLITGSSQDLLIGPFRQGTNSHPKAELEFDLTNKAYRLHWQEVMQNKRQVLQEVEAARLMEEMEQVQKKLVSQDQERKDLNVKIAKIKLEREQVDRKIEKLESLTAVLERCEAKLAKVVEQVSVEKEQSSKEKRRLAGERQVLEAERHTLGVQRRMLEGMLKASEADKPAAATSFESFRSRVSRLRATAGGVDG